MKQMELQLNNGYKIVVSIGIDDNYPNEIRIDTYDSDDTWNQELVRVSNYIKDDEVLHKYDEEHFNVKVTESEDVVHNFIINLEHDPEVNDDENDDVEDENDDSIKEEEEIFHALNYGDKGEEVKVIQRRLKELGYFNGTIGGNYLTKTQTAIKDFQTDNGLQIDGECDEVTYNRLFNNEVKKKEVKVVEDSTAEPAHGAAKAVDWWTSDFKTKICPKGTIMTITDVKTGIAWREKRRGGTNHADLEPLTAADTAAFKKAAGKWSWDRRAVFCTINGVNYAMSINCMPHGNCAIKDNNFNGHHCMHAVNSRTHCSNKVCKLHQAAIEEATKAVL